MRELKSKTKKAKIGPKKSPKEEPKKIVLVGTYGGKQLEDWPDCYNYPLYENDKIDVEACKQVNELWLFSGTKDQRTFAVEFVGVKTREELVNGYGYKAKGKGHGDGRYLLFRRIKELYVPAKGEAECVIIRTKDFAGQNKNGVNVQKQLKDYLESPDRKDPMAAKLLPTILMKLPPERLRVCEAAVQMNFFGALVIPQNVNVSCAANNRYNVISMFSGAMGLDNGIEKAGLNIRLCVEFQHAMAETIRANKPNTPLIEDDVRNYSGGDLLRAAGMTPEEEVFLVCGGPPCQAFSTAGKRLGFNDDRGNVFLKYLDLIGEIRPRYFLLENVRGLLSASYTPPGCRKGGEKGSALLFALSKIKEIGYSATFTLYDTANYGVPQKRERVIILGSRDGYRIPLIPPTHSRDGSGGLKKWETFRTAVSGLRHCTAAQIPQKRLKYFHMLGPGQYWKDLPVAIQREAMGKSFDLPGGKTGFYRRLAWDEPAPTLVTCPTMPATDLMHPTEDRALSIEEYARIQMFPDKWVFKGSVADIYKQIGNAVPVGMGYAAARHLLWFDSLSEEQKKAVQLIDRTVTYSRYKNTTYEYFEKLMTK